MALARVKVFGAEILTPSDLNAEFNNLLDNALSLISPLTAGLDAGGFDVINLDELEFDDGAADPTTTARLRRSGSTLQWRVEDARTATTIRPFAILATTTGVPAASIGVGMRFDAESADEAPSQFGALDFVATDIGAASEDTYLSVLLRVAGAVLDEKYRFSSTAGLGFAALFTHAVTADRTYTLQDATDTLVGRATTDTLTNKTIGDNLIFTAGNDIRPTVDSTTAINIANAAGTDFVILDTTNSRVRIGTGAPIARLSVNQDTVASVDPLITFYNASLPNASVVSSKLGKSDLENESAIFLYTQNATNSLLTLGHAGDDLGAGIGLVVRKGGNIKIAGTATRATAEGTNHLDIFDGTAPVGTLTAGISLYSTTGELRVMDSGGTATLLSASEKSILASSNPAWMPWAFGKENPYTGERWEVNMGKLIAWAETQSGQQFAVKKAITKLDWDIDQEKLRLQQEARIMAMQDQIAELEQQIASETNLQRKTDLIRQRDTIKIPAPYTKKRPEEWMAKRGVVSTIL